MGDRIAVMNAGVLQQLDTPQTLYDRPGNAFVAGFIGSPTMNLLDMEIQRDGGELRLVREGLTLPVPPRFADALGQVQGGRVRAGLRPEDISDRSDASSFDAPLTATVDVLELLGSEAFLYATAADAPLIARVSARADYAVGSSVALHANVDHLHLFDAATGVNLLYPAKELAGVA